MSWVSRVFGLDLRSLALFRVGLSGFVLYDLIHRAFDLTAHYTDNGVAPRDFMLVNLWNPHVFSLHMWTGTALGIAVLFLLHGVAAMALLLGYRTRLMTFLVWLFTTSLHTRNPLILNGGDDLLRVILFFAIFLPLGARYSIDEAFNTSKERRRSSEQYTSASTAVYYLQFICVYFFAALLKSSPEWRTDGTAIYYALSLDQLALPIGKVLLQFPAAMKALTSTVWWTELLGAFIFLLPHPLAKVAGIALIGGLQLGFGLTLAIGHFPWINAIALLPFIPGLAWDRKAKRQNVEIVFDPDCGFCRKMVLLVVEFLRPQLADAPRPATGQDLVTLRKRNSWIVHSGMSFFEFDAFIEVVRSSAIFWWTAPLLRLAPIHLLGNALYRTVAKHRGFLASLLAPIRFRKISTKTRWWQETLAVTFFSMVLVSNLAPVANNSAVTTLNDVLNAPIMMLRLDEYWGMFAPDPTHEDGWYVIEGRLQNGNSVDAFRQTRSLSYDKPASAGDFYPNERWRKFMMNIWLRKYKDFRGPLAHYLCWDWNRRNQGADRMERLSMYFMLEMTPPPGGTASVQKLLLAQYPCVQ